MLYICIASSGQVVQVSVSQTNGHWFESYIVSRPHVAPVLAGSRKWTLE